MKGKLAICLAAGVLLLIGGWYFWGPSSVPAGQEPLLTLSGANLDDFENAFDAQADLSRLILLVSPT
jgi:hypothetical protein